MSPLTEWQCEMMADGAQAKLHLSERP